MNPEHVALVRQGAAAIVEWRVGNPDVTFDLSEANLSRADLSHADLSHADLSRADLSGADLFSARLRIANLSDANLSDANLEFADLRIANLSDANLSSAHLGFADLGTATLKRANLSNARLISTVLGSGTASARGLGTVEHTGPSFYDSELLATPGVPDVFLRGIGVPEPIIQVLPLLRNEPIYRHSTFISYSWKNNTFAERLYNSLQGAGVRVWKDNHEIRPGERGPDFASSS